MHAVFFIPYVEPQCRSECWVDVNHDSDLIWIPPDLFSLSQKTCSLARRVFLLWVSAVLPIGSRRHALSARGRAQVGVHSAKSDWSRRILDFAYMDYDDQAAHHE